MLYWLLRRLPCLVICLPLAGCAAMGKYEKGTYRYPFAASSVDVGCMVMTIVGKPEDEPPDGFDFIYSPLFIPFFLLDLPISLVADLVMLPYDLANLPRVGQPIPRKPAEETSPPEPVTDQPDTR